MNTAITKRKELYKHISAFMLAIILIIVSYRSIMTKPAFIGYTFEWYLPPFTSLIHELFKENLYGYTYYQFGLPVLIQDYKLWSYIELIISKLIDARFLGIFYILFIHLIAFFSMYVLIGELLKHDMAILVRKLNESKFKSYAESFVFQVIPSIYYSFNPFLFNHIAAGHIYVGIAYAFFPLIFHEFIVFMEFMKNNCNAKSLLLYHSLKLGLILVLIGSKINYFALAFFAIIIFVFVLLLIYKPSIDKTIHLLIYVLIATTVALAFHNYIFLYISTIALKNVESNIIKVYFDLVLQYRKATPMSYLMLRYNVPIFYTFLKKYNLFSVYVILTTLIIAFGLAYLLIKLNKNVSKEVRVLIVNIILLYVTSLGFLQAKDIDLFKTILLHTNAFLGLLREVYHLSTFISIGNSIALYCILKNYRSIRTISVPATFKIICKILKFLLFSLLLISLIINQLAFSFTGNLNNWLQPINLSEDIENFVNTLSRDKEFYRVLWVPPILNIRYDSLPHDGIDPIIRYSPKPSFGNWLPMNYYAIFVIKQYYGLNDFIFSKSLRNISIYAMFSSVKYVIYRENFHSSTLNSNNNKLLKNLITYCKQTFTSRDIKVWECNYYPILYVPRNIVIASNLFEHLTYSISDNKYLSFIFIKDIVKSSNINETLITLKELKPIILFYPEDVYDLLLLSMNSFGKYYQLGDFAYSYSPDNGWSSAYETTRLVNPFLSDLIENFAASSKSGALIKVSLKIEKGDIFVVKALKTPVSGQVILSLCGQRLILNLKSSTYAPTWFFIKSPCNCNDIVIENLKGFNVLISLFVLSKNTDPNVKLEELFTSLYENPLQLTPSKALLKEINDKHIALYLQYDIASPMKSGNMKVISLLLGSEFLNILNFTSVHNINLCSRLEFINSDGKVLSSLYFDIKQSYLQYIGIQKYYKTIWLSLPTIIYDRRSIVSLSSWSNTNITKVFLVIDFFFNYDIHKNTSFLFMAALKRFIDNNSFHNITMKIWYVNDSEMGLCTNTLVKQESFTTWRIDLVCENNKKIFIPIQMLVNFDKNWEQNLKPVAMSLCKRNRSLHISSFGFANMFITSFECPNEEQHDKKIHITIFINYKLSNYVVLSNVISITIVCSIASFILAKSLRFLSKKLKVITLSKVKR